MIDVELMLERWGEQGVLTLINLAPGGPWRMSQHASQWEGRTMGECFDQVLDGQPPELGGSVDVELIMSELAAHGLFVMLKLDHERWAEQTQPWTFMVNEGMQGWWWRGDERTMDRAIEGPLRALRKRSADWDWVTQLL